MKCCNNEVRELLTRDVCCDTEDEHVNFAVEEPKEGQILIYSERLRAFINNSLTLGQVNADWNALNGPSSILNKPLIFSGNYSDLLGLPSLFNGDYNSLSNKPLLFSGSYNDLSDIPTITAQVNADWDSLSGPSQILNKPLLFSGDYNDLINKPSTTGDYILNQKAVDQVGNIRIDGDLISSLQSQINNNSNPCAIIGSTQVYIGDLTLDTNCTTAISSQQVSIYGNRNTIISSSQIGFTDYYGTATAGNMYGNSILSSNRFTSLGVLSDSIVSAHSVTLTGYTARSFIFGDNILPSDILNFENTFMFARNLTLSKNTQDGDKFQDCAIFGTGHTLHAYHLNAVFGATNTLKTYGAVIGGYNNSIGNNSYYSAVFGDRNFIADQSYASFIAGDDNRIDSLEADAWMYCNFIFGQANRIEQETFAFGGGAYLSGSAILSGQSNKIKGRGTCNSIIGGQSNNISNKGGVYYYYSDYNNNSVNASRSVENNTFIDSSSILGGKNNVILSTPSSAIIAGESNYIGISESNSDYYGAGDVILGGYNNKIVTSINNSVTYSAILCGSDNRIIHNSSSPSYVYYSTILGGNNNTIVSGRASILNSYDSYIRGENSTILGGESNKLNANYSIMIGSYLKSSTSYKITLGRFNEDIATNSFEIGFGANGLERKNSFWIKNNGTLGTASYNTDGTKTPVLGNNCPAVDQTKPYAWIRVELSDGSIVYMPAWK